MHPIIGRFYYLLYNLEKHYALEVRMRTWVNWLLLLLALFILLLNLPGKWYLAGLILALILFLSLSNRFARTRYYVHFRAQPDYTPQDTPPPLWPEDKLLHHASGHFEVEGKEADWTHLIAYYRTFETREHAIMARLTPSTFLKVGLLYLDDLGMWYRFITPDNLLDVTPGQSYVGPWMEPALRLRYRRFDEKDNPIQDTFFLHFSSPDHRDRVMADLLLDMGGPPRRPWRKPA